MQPIIKWAGGKRRFAESISKIIGDDFNNYYEPFVGGGAILFYMEPHNAHCMDINAEIINLYNVVKSSPEELICELENYVDKNNMEDYLRIRSLDRNKEHFNSLSVVTRAARFMYLNHTCYNGLWRVNGNGENNVPFGKYVNPKILCKEDIRMASKFFNENNVTFELCDYQNVLKYANEGDLVYFDPPYDIEKGQNGFVGYTKNGFNRGDQRRLKEVCDTLIERGVTVAISNSNTEFIRTLYSDEYHLYELHHELKVKRTIGASNNSRKEIVELLIIGRPAL